MQFPHRTSAQCRDLSLQSQSNIAETVAINIARADACLNQCILSILGTPGSSVRQGYPEDVVTEAREEPLVNYFQPQKDGTIYQTDSVDYGEWGGIADNQIDSPHLPENKNQAESETSDSRTLSRVGSTGEGSGDGDGDSVARGDEDRDSEDEDSDNGRDLNFLETEDEDKPEEEDDWEGDSKLLRNAPPVRESGTRGIRYSQVDYRNMARFVRGRGAAPYPEEWEIFNNQVSGCRVRYHPELYL